MPVTRAVSVSSNSQLDTPYAAPRTDVTTGFSDSSIALRVLSSWPPSPETYRRLLVVASRYLEVRDSSVTRPLRRPRTSGMGIWAIRSAAESCHENFDPNVEADFVG